MSSYRRWRRSETWKSLGCWQRLQLRGLYWLLALARLWLAAKAELAELHAHSEANTEIDQKTALMKAEFEALSQRLLNERSKELTSQHSDSLTQLLKPLTTELDAFKKRMNEVYENETRDRVSLRRNRVTESIESKNV